MRSFEGSGFRSMSWQTMPQRGQDNLQRCVEITALSTSTKTSEQILSVVGGALTMCKILLGILEKIKLQPIHKMAMFQSVVEQESLHLQQKNQIWDLQTHLVKWCCIGSRHPQYAHVVFERLDPSCKLKSSCFQPSCLQCWIQSGNNECLLPHSSPCHLQILLHICLHQEQMCSYLQQILFLLQALTDWKPALQP